MSFNQLPENLVAQIASKLNYTDLMNLRLSQKRMNKIVTAYHLDEGAIYKLSFVLGIEGAERRVQVEAYLTSNPDSKIILDNDNINEQVEKYRCIRIFSFVNMPLTAQVISGLMNAFIVENVVLVSCAVHVTPTEFIDLFKKHSSVSMEKMTLKEEFLNDEVFGQLVRNVDLELLYLRTDTSLTDLTLNVMIDGRLPNKFYIPYYIVKFSVDAIKKMIQKALDLGYTLVNWDFGFIGNEPDKEAADKFMEELNSDDSIPLTCEYLTDNAFDGLKYKDNNKAKLTVVEDPETRVISPDCDLGSFERRITQADLSWSQYVGVCSTTNKKEIGEWCKWFVHTRTTTTSTTRRTTKKVTIPPIRRTTTQPTTSTEASSMTNSTTVSSTEAPLLAAIDPEFSSTEPTPLSTSTFSSSSPTTPTEAPFASAKVSEERSLVWVYIVCGLVAVLLIVGAVIGAICYRKRAKKQKKGPEVIKKPQYNRKGPSELKKHDENPDLLPDGVFKKKGPLKMLRNLKGPIVHELDGVKSEPLKKPVVIDFDMMTIHKIGPGVEQYTGDETTLSNGPLPKSDTIRASNLSTVSQKPSSRRDVAKKLSKETTATAKEKTKEDAEKKK